MPEACEHEDIKAIKRDVAKVLKLLDGNGEPERGLVVRVDRIEQREKARSKVLWTVGAGALTALGTTVWGWVTKGGPTQ